MNISSTSAFVYQHLHTTNPVILIGEKHVQTTSLRKFKTRPKRSTFKYTLYI